MITGGLFPFFPHNGPAPLWDFYERIVMSEQLNDQQIEAIVDDREVRQLYSNFFRVFTAAEELILEFCFNMPNPNPTAAAKQQLLVKVADRAIMSEPTAERRANSLGQ